MGACSASFAMPMPAGTGHYRSGNLWLATRPIESTNLVVYISLINTTSLVNSTKAVGQARPIIGLGLSVASSQKIGQGGGLVAGGAPGGEGGGG